MVPFVWIVHCTMSFSYLYNDFVSGKLVVLTGKSNFVLLDIQCTTLPSSYFQFGQRGLLTKFAFILCHKVCICPMSESLRSSYVTKFAFVPCHKVCIYPISQSLCSSSVTKFSFILCHKVCCPFLLVDIGWNPLIYIQISATIWFHIIYQS